MIDSLYVSLGAPTIDSAAVRAWFPSLSSGFAYLENAGGSQVPGVVAEAMHHYLLNSYVQIGAGYQQSQTATETVAEAHRFVAQFMNADDRGPIVLGSSATQLINLAATAIGETIQTGDEIVVAISNHEANIGAWLRLEQRGATVRFWDVDPESTLLLLEDLTRLLTSRTRLVVVPHVSNLLGDVLDIEAVVKLAKPFGAQVFCDGVAYAPHRAIDVAKCGVDWYVYSTYKVYGPHMAALFGTNEAFATLRGPNHFFIGGLPGQFELGSLNHEGCAGILALRPYLQFLAGKRADEPETVRLAYETMRRLEAPATERLLSYLRSKSDVRIIGSASGNDAVGIVSFVHHSLTSPQIVAAVDAHPIGIRYGHMYAYRLLQQLGIDPLTGVVRVSLAHYNTVEEIERLIEVLEAIL